MITLTAAARRVLEARYLRRNAAGEIAETPAALFRRVARAVARAEVRYGGEQAAAAWAERFEEAMAALEFLPNSPTLMNAGTRVGQLSACFVLPVEDRMRDIFEALKLMALVQQTGGGTGFAFSRLRPAGDWVASTGGRAAGPLAFMRIFDCATEHIRQGGRRRGANMGVLRVDHPDVAAFVDAKRDRVSFANFNFSVGVTDAFVKAAAAGEPWPLVNPRTGRPTGRADAPALWERIALAAWETGDPGLIFLDAVNRAHPLGALGPIEATNPCGEVPLLPFESCTLGSVNLARLVRGPLGAGAVDWERLAERVRLGVRFLDDVLDVGRWPDRRLARAARRSRKIGLGVMGFAELLIRLGIPYGSAASVALAEELMAFVAAESRRASRELAAERGVFPAFDQSAFAAAGEPRRNATLNSIAPTGTLAILAGTSPGIEPLFGLVYRREGVLNGERLLEVNPLFARLAAECGVDLEQVVPALAARGRLAEVPGVPEPLRALFRTALEIPPEEHLAVQAAFQRHVDNAVSKTVNLPHDAPPERVAAIYRAAWEAGVKGITVYRYGSRDRQVMQLGAGEPLEAREHFARCDPHDCRL